MKILLHRYRVGEFATDGSLSIGGEKICDTTEHTLYRPPAGTYTIVLKYSKAHHRKMPFLAEAGVCLAPGNGIYGCTDGRILLGTSIVPGCMKHSRQPFMRLYDRINTSIRRGHQVSLTISEDSP